MTPPPLAEKSRELKRPSPDVPICLKTTKSRAPPTKEGEKRIKVQCQQFSRICTYAHDFRVPTCPEDL